MTDNPPSTIWAHPDKESPSTGTYIEEYAGGVKYLRADIAKRNVKLERAKQSTLYDVIDKLKAANYKMAQTIEKLRE